MRNTLLFVLIAALVLPLAAISAQDFVDLEELTAEFPAEDTIIFMAARVDDAFIGSLDSTLAPFYPFIEDLPPGFTLEQGLDLAVMEAGVGSSFAEDIRPWLGDTVAVGLFADPVTLEDTEFLSVQEFTNTLEAVVAIDIADRAGAEAFIEGVLAEQGSDLEATERGGYTAYEIPFGPLVLVGDDTALIGEEFIMAEYGLIDGDFESVGDSADYANTVNTLPASSYVAGVYVSQPAYRSVVELIAETSTDPFGQEDAQELLETLDMLGLGSIAAGATSIEGGTLALDVTLTGGANPYQNVDLGSIDPAFASLIPATTPFVIHGTNLRGQYDAVVETIAQLETAGIEEIEDGVAETNEALQAETGLTLEDVFGWMVNDYALILRPSDSAQNATSIFGLVGNNPLDLGVLIDASEDPAAAVALVDAIETGLQGELAATITEGENAEVDLELTREGDILNLQIIDNNGQIPFPVNLQVGVTDDVFFIGTPGVASSIISGDGGLASTDTFNAALPTLLSEPVSIYYIDVGNLSVLVDIAESFAEEEADVEDLQTTSDILALFSHFTLSQAVDADGNSFVRATISLN